MPNQVTLLGLSEILKTKYFTVVYTILEAMGFRYNNKFMESSL